MITGTVCSLTDCRYGSESATAICGRDGCPLMTEPPPFKYHSILDEPVCEVCRSRPAKQDFNGMLCAKCTNMMEDPGWA